MENYPVHIEVLPKVHLIRGDNNARFPEANSLLIDDEVLTLVDAGSAKENIEKTFRDLGHESSSLDQIILTHFHIDHKGYAMHFRNLSDCEIITHPQADRGVMSFDGMVEFYGIGDREHYSDWEELLGWRLPHVLSDYDVTGHFKEGKPIDCGETSLIPIYAPGHTHDHTCFAINDNSTIFLVDIDLTRFGPWYGNVVSDIEDFKRTMKKIIDHDPKMGISSHLLNPVTEDLISKLVTYTAKFQEREDRILKHIQEGRDTVQKLREIPTIYPRIPYDAYYTFEEIMIEKHVEVLIKKDILLMEDGHFEIKRR